jgi:hypothetical protein
MATAHALRWRCVQAITNGIASHPDLGGVQVTSGMPGSDTDAESIFCGDVTGTLTVPLMMAGRKIVDDRFTIRVYATVTGHTDHDTCGQRITEITGAVVDWMQDSLADLSVLLGPETETATEGLISINPAGWESTGPIRTPDDVRALAHIDIDFYARYA